METERYSPPSKKAEKFFGYSAPLKWELSVRTEGFSRKLRPSGEDIVNAKCKVQNAKLRVSFAETERCFPPSKAHIVSLNVNPAIIKDVPTVTEGTSFFKSLKAISEGG